MGNKQAANIEDCVLEAAPEQARTTGVQLAEQLAWHWRNQVRERLAGLSDEEYFWEPAEPSWSLRPRGRSDAPVQGGSGELVIEFAFAEPDPAPFTTIAWRLGHVLVGVLGTRNATHFGHEPTDYFGYDYPVTAAEALARLERELRRWVAGVAVLTDDQLWQPVGESEGGLGGSPHDRAGAAYQSGSDSSPLRGRADSRPVRARPPRCVGPWWFFRWRPGGGLSSVDRGATVRVRGRSET